VGGNLTEEGVFGGHDSVEGDLEAGQILLEPGKAEHLSDVHWHRNLGEIPESTTTGRGWTPPIGGALESGGPEKGGSEELDTHG
jgi:hypothetical protein